MARVGEIVSPTSIIQAVKDDDDNRILECAIDGKAALIVSSFGV
jgi:predicted nucleic acid-binding protein